MRKKFIALVLIVVFIFTVTGCGSIRTVEGPDLKKPVFVKELIYTDEMNVDLSYIQDYNWDKRNFQGFHCRRTKGSDLQGL